MEKYSIEEKKQQEYISDSINDIISFIKDKTTNKIDKIDLIIFGFILGYISNTEKKKFLGEGMELIYSIYKELEKNENTAIKINDYISLYEQTKTIYNNLNDYSPKKINNINLDNSDNNFNLLDSDNNNNMKKELDNKNLFEDIQNNKETTAKCLICLEEYNYSEELNYFLDCGCIIHYKCFDNYIIQAINSGKFPIKCPYCNKENINENYIKDSLIQNKREDLLNKLEHFTMNYYIMNNPNDVSCCPTAGCDYIFIYDEKDNEFLCPNCHKKYCLNCKTEWHEGRTCKEYKETMELSKFSNDVKKLDDLFLNFAKGSKFKQCPYCKHWVEKNEGCKHIACRCGHHFCYDCGGKMDGNIRFHKCLKIKKKGIDANRNQIIRPRSSIVNNNNDRNNARFNNNNSNIKRKIKINKAK